ncbi:hypothetical protein V5799_024017 [Amblyomma americanum]|uniref:DDE Tnp4 domain-containing protein n=1 Tax=Amblyomma americanum TaxID=6943 RepID=A0AAQ4ED70_AMBAM
MDRGLLSTVIQTAMELVDSDSSDEEELEELIAVAVTKLARLKRNRMPRYCEEVVGRYYDFEFRRLFRLSRSTFETVVSSFEASQFFPHPTGGRPRVSAEKTCLVALGYLGHQNGMYSLADRFDMSVSSVSACVNRVLDFLNSISASVIAWPDQRQQERIKAAFLAKTGGKGPRNTIGCVDGSHVEINRPAESPQSYYNRKKWPSIILQGVCDDRNRFINVFIGFPGSAHDARVLRESPIFEDCSQNCSNGYLLGDSAYPLLPWLLTPYRDNGRSFPSWKKKFNKVHSQQRVAIENSFGLLKQRFRRLYLVDAASIKQCCLIVMAACVLHNMCNEERDFFEDLEHLPQQEEIDNGEDDDLIFDSAGNCESMRNAIAQTQC